MDKYWILIEKLKEVYSNELYHTRIAVEKSDADNDILSFEDEDFIVSCSINTIKKHHQITEYHIQDKGTGKEWHFLVVNATFLFAYQFEKNRAELLENESIIGIITIKRGFFEKILLPAAVILLGESNQTWLSSAATTDDVIALVGNPEQYERKVYYTDKLDPKNFMPEHYNGEIQELDEELSRYDSKRLGDIADIVLGKSVSKDEFSDEGIPYLRARDIQDGHLILSNVYVDEKNAQKYARQLLQEGDILLSKNFGQHKITQITADDLPAIASNGLFIIRAYGVPDNYLYQYLTSDTGKAIFDRQLTSIERGGIVASINLKDLAELQVPIFDQKTMIDFSDIEDLKEVELINSITSMSRLSKYAGLLNHNSFSAKEKEIEKQVCESFRGAGWKNEEIVTAGKEYSIAIGDKIEWRPDIVLLDYNEKLAVVEVKTDFALFSGEYIKKLHSVIQSGVFPFFILTTGKYYEIHSANNKIIRKMMGAPTKGFLLSLLEGKEGE